MYLPIGVNLRTSLQLGKRSDGLLDQLLSGIKTEEELWEAIGETIMNGSAC